MHEHEHEHEHESAVIGSRTSQPISLPAFNKDVLFTYNKCLRHSPLSLTLTSIPIHKTNHHHYPECLSVWVSHPSRHPMSRPHSFSPPLDTRSRIIQPDPTCTARRHRHSISGQMSYFKLLGYNVSKKLTGSANSLFSTAVISGSSSAPNLKDMVPPHASAVAGTYYIHIYIYINI